MSSESNDRAEGRAAVRGVYYGVLIGGVLWIVILMYVASMFYLAVA